MLGVMAFPVCGAPRKVASKLGSGGVLVFDHGAKLEAIRDGQNTPTVLRDEFGSDDWKFSPDGRHIALAAVPRDLGITDNAASARIYLFTARFNSQERILLGSYSSRFIKNSFGFEFGDVFWNATGSRLVVSEQLAGLAGDRGEIALRNAVSGRETWSSRSISRQFLESGAKKFNYSFHVSHPFEETDSPEVRSLFAPVLSPDGSDLICLCSLKPIDTHGFNLLEGDKAPPTFLVHFDLRRNIGEVVGAIDDEFSAGRIRVEGSTISGGSIYRYRLKPQFEWHPTQKKVVFVGPASPTDPTRNLFIFDLPSKTLTHLTNSDESDFSPQWSLDGKQLFWIRGNGNSINADAFDRKPDTTSSASNQIFRANADGSNATPILPQLRGVTRIQLLPKIADWSRYRKLSIEPLAEKNK